MDCTNNNYPLTHHLTAMARKSGTLIGLPIVAVTGHNDQGAQSDDGLPRTFERYLVGSIGTDSCGLPAIRVKFIDSCDTAITCKVEADNILDQIFAYDATTKTFAIVLNQST